MKKTKSNVKTSVRWIVEYGGKSKSDRNRAVFSDDKKAAKFFNEESKDKHVSVFKETTVVTTENIS